MKREIKFRAWVDDGGFKKMLHFIGEILFAQGSGVKFVVSDEGVQSVSCPGDKVTLLQFTGLRDTLGVEIYEGDIVELDGGKWEVYMDLECGHWRLKQGTMEYDNGDYYHGDQITWANCEVVGNIYENPEMMK